MDLNVHYRAHKIPLLNTIPKQMT